VQVKQFVSFSGMSICLFLSSYVFQIIFGQSAETNSTQIQMPVFQIKENEVGRACGMCGRGEKRVQGFGGKAQRKKTT
jgi:hypothetical protein